MFSRFVGFSLEVFSLSSELSFFLYSESIAVYLPKEFECWGGFILNQQFPILERSRIPIVFRNNFLSPLVIRVSQQLKNKGVLYK